MPFALAMSIFLRFRGGAKLIPILNKAGITSSNDTCISFLKAQVRNFYKMLDLCKFLIFL